MVNNSVMEPLVAEKLPTRYEVAIAIFSFATKPGSAEIFDCFGGLKAP